MMHDRTYDSREVWWGNALVHNIVEVNVLEEGVALDLLCISLTGTKTSRGVTGQKLRVGQYTHGCRQ